MFLIGQTFDLVRTCYRKKPSLFLRLRRTARIFHYYFISCSRASNSGVEKNSARVISRLSQIFFIVRILGSTLLPYRMFFTDDGGRAHIVVSLLMEIFRSTQSLNPINTSFLVRNIFNNILNAAVEIFAKLFKNVHGDTFLAPHFCDRARVQASNFD